MDKSEACWIGTKRGEKETLINCRWVNLNCFVIHEAEEVGSHLGNYATASAPSMGLVTTDAECENSMTEEDEGTEPVNEGFLESPPVAGVVKEASQPPAAVRNVEDIVNIDETDCEDNSDGDDEADLLIFEESLLKHLKKTNEKGIETIKWNGKI